MLKEAIARLMKREDLDRAEISAVFSEIFSGHATPAQIAGFLVALRMKGETPEEIAGGAEAMRKNVTKVRAPKGRIVLDTCGTGGDGSHSFNISTAVAFVAAGRELRWPSTAPAPSRRAAAAPTCSLPRG